MEAELLKEMAINLPNFVFAGLAIIALYKICNRLLDEVVTTCREAKEATLSNHDEK